jgi:hypothetical protein
MKSRLFTWLGRDFIEISGEGKAGVPPDVATEDLFARCESELRSHGFSLENTARIRVWGRDKDARTLATAARAKILTGQRKAASSSFISQQWFDSDGTVGLELLAMKPRDSGAERRPVDFEPARNYLCYLDTIPWCSTRVIRRLPIRWRTKSQKFLRRSPVRARSQAV